MPETARVTPRVSQEGVLLRVETQVASVSPTPVSLGNGVFAPAFNVETVQTTGAVPDGGTLVIRGPRSKTVDGGTREILIVATIHRVAPAGR